MQSEDKTVVFISTYLSPHQIPFSEALANMEHIQYTYVAVDPFDQDRASLGYKDANYLYPYVLRAYEDSTSMRKAKEVAESADIVIIGSASEDYIIPRLKSNKLTFMYSERLYKQSLSIKEYPRAAGSAWKHHGRFQKYPLYMLCASAFTAADCAKFGNYLHKTYRWGYFPNICSIPEADLFKAKREKRKTSILWVGRFLRWKHPEAAICVADRLKKQGYEFELNMIGCGELEEELKQMINDLGLNDCVHMLGSMSPEDVQKNMARSDIFLFTSDFQEGWGAVLNESMGNGCAVVASHAIGAVPFLMKNRENGLIYHSGNNDELYGCVKEFMDHPDYRKLLGSNAYRTITTLWNAETAAERLLKLCEDLMSSPDQQCRRYSDGPCSPAPIIKNKWFE